MSHLPEAHPRPQRTSPGVHLTSGDDKAGQGVGIHPPWTRGGKEGQGPVTPRGGHSHQIEVTSGHNQEHL